MSKDKKIIETLERYGESFADSVWRVQGTAVIYHKALERIAERAGITFEAPTVIRAERDEAVILVTGYLPTGKTLKDKDPETPDWVDGPEMRSAWSFGEAVINVNYRVSGKQAAYVFAMAEKRAKDRVILKLLEISGLVFSEEEADEFRAKPRNAPAVQGAHEEEWQDEEPGLTKSQEMAEGMMVALRKRLGTAAVEAFLAHPKVKADLEALEMDEFTQVMRVAAEQRALEPMRAAS